MPFLGIGVIVPYYYIVMKPTGCDIWAVRREQQGRRNNSVFCVLCFPLFLILIILFFVFKSKTNPRSQGEVPNVARQRFRRSDYWDPGQRKPVATLHSEVNQRKEVLRVQRLPKDVPPISVPFQDPSACAHGWKAVRLPRVRKEFQSQLQPADAYAAPHRWEDCLRHM